MSNPRSQMHFFVLGSIPKASSFIQVEAMARCEAYSGLTKIHIFNEYISCKIVVDFLDVLAGDTG